MIEPKLILVGAGPGDEGLITLKGVQAIEQADVILYDALANPALLKYAKESCIKVFVGKRSGLHHYQQFVINKMIVDYAHQHGTVVRLKGGDPFVFGRGHEEAEYALKHGLKVENVPGISSAIAVPAANNIPVTKRGASESFWVITGTTKNGTLSKDLNLAAQSSATVIILMGMKKLNDIIKIFANHRSIKEPIAIIQNGTRENQKTVLSDLSNIAEESLKKQVAPPAIIIIGKVVEEKYKYDELPELVASYQDVVEKP